MDAFEIIPVCLFLGCCSCGELNTRVQLGGRPVRGELGKGFGGGPSLCGAPLGLLFVCPRCVLSAYGKRDFLLYLFLLLTVIMVCVGRGGNVKACKMVYSLIRNAFSFL